MIAGLSLIILVGFCDYITGYEISFSIFYIIPISLVSWEFNRFWGVVTAFLSAIVWFYIEFNSNEIYSSYLIPIWNGIVRLIFFLIVSILLSRLKQSLDYEKRLARTDNLTGAVNGRFFYELLQIEMNRTQRYQNPLTIVYVDLDNFKMVNDKLGHAKGDQTLKIVVDYLTQHLRNSDTIARLGGDEFAILMRDTDQQCAKVSLARIQNGLLKEMKFYELPISVSMGALTYNHSLISLDELIRIADNLMYEVKRDGKNGVRYGVYPPG